MRQRSQDTGDVLLADLHIHSRFSRACSRAITIPKLAAWAKVKGLRLLGTGDFTHPAWMQELKDTCEERDGLLWHTPRRTVDTPVGTLPIPTSNNALPFLLSVEVSNIYREADKTRKVHTVILAPDLATADSISHHLQSKGKLASDGRPILGSYSCRQLAKDMHEISPDIELIPAHIWTPWFSALGSKSGFESIAACYGEAPNIHVIETGLSSDPVMNRGVHSLDKYGIVSFSDAHSFWPWKLGREATAFRLHPQRISYPAILRAIRKQDIAFTVEVDPGFGKYHFAGHRRCGVRMDGPQSAEVKGICPVCHKPLTEGVLQRVEQLAQEGQAEREKKGKHRAAMQDVKTVPPFRQVLPLSEIIAAFHSTTPSTKKVWNIYNRVIAHCGDEFSALLEKQDFSQISLHPTLAAFIDKNRLGKVAVEAGYDGVFGKIQP